MCEQKHLLERYLKVKFDNRPGLSIAHLDKLRDGWESDNYILCVDDDSSRTRTSWVWRIYSGTGSQAKAAREFNAMQKLHVAGYPVPEVILLETEDSPVERPFILMEYIPGDMMWHMLDVVSETQQEQLIDQFSRLFVRLHVLNWRNFDDRLPDDEPFFFIDRWLDEARGTLQRFPQLDLSGFLEWVSIRRELFACPHPSPVHRDFHPGNILVKADNSASVIDWTQFEVTDFRFDLAWTLVLAHGHGFPGMRDQILAGYQRHAAGQPVAQIELFETVACAQRLFSIAVSLTQGAQRMGMNAQAAESMRATMDAHQRVYRLFMERTGLQIEAFDSLFGIAQ